MNIIFKEKYGNLTVRVISLCTHVSTLAWNDYSGNYESATPFESAFSITNTDLVKVSQKCILCTDVNSNETYTIPLLEFMNMFQPYDGYISDMMRTVEKIKNMEDEENREDIHTLHSEQSEDNEVAVTE